jgi:hypothetical protein
VLRSNDGTIDPERSIDGFDFVFNIIFALLFVALWIARGAHVDLGEIMNFMGAGYLCRIPVKATAKALYRHYVSSWIKYEEMSKRLSREH